MNEDNTFIGMGRNPNPNVPDIPVGFGMELMQNSDARANFESLSDGEKTRLIAYIQGGVTGDEAKQRIYTAIDKLNKADFSFF